MTKYVSIIGNGESRRGFDISPLKSFSTVIGCNAVYRDFVTEYLVCADRHMCQQAVNAVGKGTTILTRQDWADQFAHWPNVKKFPDLPYKGEKRQDEPFHWGTGQFAALVGMSFKPKAIFLVGMDLWGLGKENKPENVNNIYKGSKGYTYIKRPVDPSYWIYQFNKLFENSECRWIIVNEEGWKMPEEWKSNKNVFQDTYQGLATWINKQLTKD